MITAPGSAKPLQPGREIGRLARYPPLLRLARANKIADHHQPGSDSNARLELLACRRQFCDAFDQREPGPDRPLCVVSRAPAGSRNR